MANEQAVPEEKSEKVHGDKLDGVLEATADKGPTQGKAGGGSPLSSHMAQPVDGEDGGGPSKSDGKPMP